MPPFLRLGWLLAVLSVAHALPAQTPAPAYPALNAKEAAELDKEWGRIRQRRPLDGSREIYAFLLTAAARGWHPERLPAVIDLAEEMHETDPAKKGYGNYRWHWNDPAPDDFNSVEFCLQTAGLTWVLYRDRLVPEARAKLAAAIALGTKGLLGHKVPVDYDNIFLMRLANAVLIGQSTGRPELVARGAAWLEEWLAQVRRDGLHEFSSPTYYGVDLAVLGSLVRYADDPGIRAKAAAAHAFLWTDIAANWFEPHQGITGPCSRDYGFLTGHGYLDQQFVRAGWIRGGVTGESRPVLDDVTYVDPPPGVRAQWGPGTRVVARHYGAKPAELAVHYVGRHFTLGSAGEAYGAQDRMFALTFDGGPRQPIANFSFDYRDDHYGQDRIRTSGGHSKLTHLVPFVASVQRAAEVLFAGSVDPQTTPNPAGRNQPMAYAGVWATLVLPREVEVWQGGHPVATGAEVPLQPAEPVFLRAGDVAAAVRFVLVRDDHGRSPGVSLIRDGDGLGAQRLSAVLAPGKPGQPVLAALWVRAAEGLDDKTFAAFCTAFARDNAGAQGAEQEGVLTLAVTGAMGPLKIEADLRTRRVLHLEGGDPAMAQGILNVNGKDYGSMLPTGTPGG
ncbi:MAG: hypothetical protein ACHQ5A_04630 [Opitutales bacterium]